MIPWIVNKQHINKLPSIENQALILLQTSPPIDMSPHSNTLSWFQVNQSLLFLLNAPCLAEKQQTWYSWKIAELVLINKHSLTPCDLEQNGCYFLAEKKK
jgi:hypothetical protein